MRLDASQSSERQASKVYIVQMAAQPGPTYQGNVAGFAKTARDEGFDEIAEWLETLARAEKSHAGRFTQGLESLS